MTRPDLKPRVIAALCALRSGPKTTNQIGTAIGDGSCPAGRQATKDLLIDMQRPGMDLVVGHEGRWYLDHDGRGWLQSNGLDAVKEARIWNVIDGAALAARAIRRGDQAAATTAAAVVAAMHGVPLSAVHIVRGEPEIAQRCPHGRMPREAGAGHWRDWHRGHGCHLDPSIHHPEKGTP